MDIVPGLLSSQRGRDMSHSPVAAGTEAAHRPGLHPPDSHWWPEFIPRIPVPHLWAGLVLCEIHFCLLGPGL